MNALSTTNFSYWVFQEREILTTSGGVPVGDKLASLTAGPRGPLLLQDITYIDEIAHFDRERIPERVVHAKGAGAFGYFEVTHDITDICKVIYILVITISYCYWHFKKFYTCHFCACRLQYFQSLENRHLSPFAIVLSVVSPDQPTLQEILEGLP